MPSFYISLAEPIPGIDAVGLEGRALSRHSDEIEKLAQQAGVRSLMSFFSVDRQDALGLIDASEGDIAIPEEAWFSADEGLTTISALLGSTELAHLSSGTNLARELGEFQRVLEAARAANIRWHLAIDY